MSLIFLSGNVIFLVQRELPLKAESFPLHLLSLKSVSLLLSSLCMSSGLRVSRSAAYRRITR